MNDHINHMESANLQNDTQSALPWSVTDIHENQMLSQSCFFYTDNENNFRDPMVSENGWDKFSSCFNSNRCSAVLFNPSKINIFENKFCDWNPLTN